MGNGTWTQRGLGGTAAAGVESPEGCMLLCLLAGEPSGPAGSEQPRVQGGGARRGMGEGSEAETGLRGVAEGGAGRGSETEFFIGVRFICNQGSKQRASCPFHCVTVFHPFSVFQQFLTEESWSWSDMAFALRVALAIRNHWSALKVRKEDAATAL